MGLKLIFMGTPEFAVPILKSLKESEHQILSVYTQPPKKSKRGQQINISPVHKFSNKFKINVRSPNSLNKETDAIISVFAGRIANAGIDPEPTMKYAVSLSKDYPNIEILWASTREVFNVIQAERCGCDIITMTPSLIKAMDDLGRDLDEYSLDTVKMFYKDATEAGFNF